MTRTYTSNFLPLNSLAFLDYSPRGGPKHPDLILKSSFQQPVLQMLPPTGLVFSNKKNIKPLGLLTCLSTGFDGFRSKLPSAGRADTDIHVVFLHQHVSPVPVNSPAPPVPLLLRAPLNLNPARCAPWAKPQPQGRGHLGCWLHGLGRQHEHQPRFINKGLGTRT